MSEKSLIDHISQPCCHAWLGFNPMTKRLLFFDPPSLGCFGFTNNYTDQGISQVKMLLSHLRHQDEIGHMIQIMIENAQLAIGLSLRPLTYNPQVFIQYIESSWITSVWEFLHSIKGQAQLEDSWELGIQRVHDQNLMDIWTHSALNLAPKELKRLNACRHFLQPGCYHC